MSEEKRRRKKGLRGKKLKKKKKKKSFPLLTLTPKTRQYTFFGPSEHREKQVQQTCRFLREMPKILRELQALVAIEQSRAPSTA